jgi:hypothetical protein
MMGMEGYRSRHDRCIESEQTVLVSTASRGQIEGRGELWTFVSLLCACARVYRVYTRARLQVEKD